MILRLPCETDGLRGGLQRSDLASIRGLIFDMDGVLLHSTEAHRRAFETVFQDFGITNFQYSNWAGWRTPDVVRAVFQQELPELPAEDVIAACAARKSALARDAMAHEDLAAPDCVETIRHLAGGYALALASSGSRASVNAFLERQQISGCFVSVLSGDDVAKAKPDPEIFSRSVLNLGLAPEECAVIEDAVAGIQAARAAGTTAIGLGETDALIRAGAHFTVNSLTGLASLLKRS